MKMAADVSLFTLIIVSFCLQLCSSSKDQVLKVITQSTISMGNVYFEVVNPEEIAYSFKIRPAKNFGSVLNTTLHNVELTPVEPLHGCSELTNSEDLFGTIAFVERGDCSFMSKALQAEKAGAIGVIIMDNDRENYERMIDMIGDDTERSTKIPAFFLLGKDGHMILQTLNKLHLSYAMINIPINITSVQEHKLNRPPWSLW